MDFFKDDEDYRRSSFAKFVDSIEVGDLLLASTLLENVDRRAVLYSTTKQFV